jgi:hypothetical protein
VVHGFSVFRFSAVHFPDIQLGAAGGAVFAVEVEAVGKAYGRCLRALSSRDGGAGLSVEEGFDDLLVHEDSHSDGLALGEIRRSGPFVQNLPVHAVIAGDGVEPNPDEAGALVGHTQLQPETLGVARLELGIDLDRVPAAWIRKRVRRGSSR